MSSFPISIYMQIYVRCIFSFSICTWAYYINQNFLFVFCLTPFFCCWLRDWNMNKLKRKPYICKNPKSFDMTDFAAPLWSLWMRTLPYVSIFQFSDFPHDIYTLCTLLYIKCTKWTLRMSSHGELQTNLL